MDAPQLASELCANPDTPTTRRRKIKRFISIPSWLFSKKTSITGRREFCRAGQETILKEGSAFGRVEDRRFEIEGLNLVFECAET